MLRRIVLAGLATAAVMTVVSSAPATAANATTRQSIASASWGEDPVPDGSGLVQRTADVRLVIDNSRRTTATLTLSTCVNHFDSSGAFSGATCTRIDGATSGFSYSFSSKLSSAAVHANGVTARRCELDSSFNEVSCTTGPLTADVSWTGVGATSKDTTTSPVAGGKLTTTTATRAATSTGSIDGTSLGSATLATLSTITAKSSTR